MIEFYYRKKEFKKEEVRPSKKYLVDGLQKKI